MVANNFETGKKFKNKEIGDVVEVVEMEDGAKLFEGKFGRWNYLDEDLFIEL